MRGAAVCVAASWLSTIMGCTAPDRGALQGFAHLTGGEWTTTLEAGTVLRQVWSWEPDGRSLRMVGQGDSADGTPWREDQLIFIDAASGVVRALGSNSYRDSRFEGTVTVGERSAEAQFVLTQRTATRRIVQRWRFENDDRFETGLHEFIEGEGLVPLVSWIYTRSHAPTRSTPSS